uniref:Uncharacterized protein n=1 Tax=viral metagenome TaxID=1070528 RepID=A0A6M3LHI4_9ZZZZ
MENNNSIMERRMEALGINRKPKTEQLLNTLEERAIEISYLRQLENAARRRMSILYKIHQATYDHVLELEKQRHKLERLFIPITHVGFRHREVPQYVSSRSKDEILKTWQGLPQAEIDKLIAQLEGLN